MMLLLLNLLLFVACCTAEINMARTKDMNLNLTIGNYTEHTVTSCKMRCASNSNCASIALKEFPNTGHRPFVCYLLQSNTDAKENGTIKKEVKSEKMIVVDKVEKFEDDEKRNQTECRADTLKPSPPSSTVKPVFFKKSLSIERSQKLVTLKRLYQSYNLTFELYLNKKHEKETTIIHLTIGESFGRYGDRTPAIFLSNKHTLSITSAVNRNVNYLTKISLVLQIKRWYKITVSQTKQENPPFSFTYRIEIDGETMFETGNSDARDFEDVSLYASSPWVNPADAKIRNLALYTSPTE